MKSLNFLTFVSNGTESFYRLFYCRGAYYLFFLISLEPEAREGGSYYFALAAISFACFTYRLAAAFVIMIVFFIF